MSVTVTRPCRDPPAGPAGAGASRSMCARCQRRPDLAEGLSLAVRTSAARPRRSRRPAPPGGRASRLRRLAAGSTGGCQAFQRLAAACGPRTRPFLDGVGGSVQDHVEVALLGMREVAEDVLHGATPAAPRCRHATGRILRAKLADDRAQPIVATSAAALAKPQTAERKRHVVDHDEQVVERSPLASQDLAHRGAREIHVGRRFHEDELGVTERPRTVAAPSRALARPAALLRSARRSRTSQPMLWRVFS